MAIFTKSGRARSNPFGLYEEEIEPGIVFIPEATDSALDNPYRRNPGEKFTVTSKRGKSIQMTRRQIETMGRSMLAPGEAERVLGRSNPVRTYMGYTYDHPLHPDSRAVTIVKARSPKAAKRLMGRMGSPESEVFLKVPRGSRPGMSVSSDNGPGYFAGASPVKNLKDLREMVKGAGWNLESARLLPQSGVHAISSRSEFEHFNKNPKRRVVASQWLGDEDDAGTSVVHHVGKASSAKGAGKFRRSVGAQDRVMKLSSGERAFEITYFDKYSKRNMTVLSMGTPKDVKARAEDVYGSSLRGIREVKPGQKMHEWANPFEMSRSTERALTKAASAAAGELTRAFVRSRRNPKGYSPDDRGHAFAGVRRTTKRGEKAATSAREARDTHAYMSEDQLLADQEAQLEAAFMRRLRRNPSPVPGISVEEVIADIGGQEWANWDLNRAGIMHWQPNPKVPSKNRKR